MQPVIQIVPTIELHFKSVKNYFPSPRNTSCPNKINVFVIIVSEKEVIQKSIQQEIHQNVMQYQKDGLDLPSKDTVDGKEHLMYIAIGMLHFMEQGKNTLNQYLIINVNYQKLVIPQFMELKLLQSIPLENHGKE